MICLNGKQELTFSNMGLFSTSSPWTHPTVRIDTYEILYVTEGIVRIREEEREYTLRKGDCLLLSRGAEHGGFGGKTVDRTAFFWLHFSTPDIGAWSLPKTCSLPESAEKDLRELMHEAESDPTRAELRLSLFLLSLSDREEKHSRLLFEVEEYLRLHAAENLTVKAVADHFGYSPDHLSKSFKREFGYDLKAGINKRRVEKMQEKLLNTNDPVKSIARDCGFEDENLFVKFFRYHTGTTPTAYRNHFFRVHRNNH